MSSSVKGTTRVSSNDRKLMKDLWVASKDNPLEKNRQKRKLTQNEKATRDDMPNERGKSAFKSLLKRQKLFDSHFETRKGDDVVAAQTIQQTGWPDFCLRQMAHCSAVQESQLFLKILNTRKKRSSNDPKFKKAIEWIEPTADAFYSGEEADSMKTFHFLGDFKNKRFANYRQKCEAQTQKASRYVTDATLKRLHTAKTVHENDPRLKNVELEFTTDYESSKHPRISLKCDLCNQVVMADVAVHCQNKLFFHCDCCKSEKPNAERKKYAFDIFSQLCRQKI